jgi:hypothetical protein
MTLMYGKVGNSERKEKLAAGSFRRQLLIDES